MITTTITTMTGITGATSAAGRDDLCTAAPLAVRAKDRALLAGGAAVGAHVASAPSVDIGHPRPESTFGA